MALLDWLLLPGRSLVPTPMSICLLSFWMRFVLVGLMLLLDTCSSLSVLLGFMSFPSLPFRVFSLKSSVFSTLIREYIIFGDCCSSALDAVDYSVSFSFLVELRKSLFLTVMLPSLLTVICSEPQSTSLFCEQSSLNSWCSMFESTCFFASTLSFTMKLLNFPWGFSLATSALTVN